MPVFYHILYISIEVRLAQLKQRFLHFLMMEAISIRKPMDRFPIFISSGEDKTAPIFFRLVGLFSSGCKSRGSFQTRHARPARANHFSSLSA